MVIRLITLFSLLFLATSQPNYQERNVYYNETDNCCRYRGDNINLIINLNDQDRIKKVIDGETYCQESWFPSRYASLITTRDSAYILESEGRDIVTEIYFKQEATKKFTFGLLSQLIMKVTVTNPIKIDNILYQCTIFGDGTIQHFGNNLDTDPAEIYMRCLTTKSQQVNTRQTGNIRIDQAQK